VSRGHKHALHRLKHCCCTGRKPVLAVVGHVAMGDGGMEEESRGCVALLLNIAFFVSYENFTKALPYQHHSTLLCFHSSSCESWKVYHSMVVGSVSLKDLQLFVTNDSLSSQELWRVKYYQREAHSWSVCAGCGISFALRFQKTFRAQIEDLN